MKPSLSGIRTVEDLRIRCRIDDETGCWLWGGASQDGAGMTWLPSLNTVRVISFAALYLTDRTPKPGHVSYMKCRNKMCCNPEHATSGTRKEASMHLAVVGHFKNNPKRMAALLAIAKKARALTDEQAQEIRVSAELGYQIAQRMGVSKSVVSRIRRGEVYRERPMLQGASVFSL